MIIFGDFITSCYHFRYKLVLAEIVVESLKPVRERIQQYLEDKAYLNEVLNEGAEKASAIATECWYDVRSKIGFGNSNLRSKRKNKNYMHGP